MVEILELFSEFKIFGVKVVGILTLSYLGC